MNPPTQRATQARLSSLRPGCKRWVRRLALGAWPVKYGLCLLVATVANVLIFAWMQALVREQAPSQAPKETVRKALRLAAPQRFPRPKPVQPSPAAPSAKRLAKVPAVVPMAMPSTPPAAAAAMNDLALAAPSRPSLGPMSVRGRLWKGPAPGKVGAGAAGSGNGASGQGAAAQAAAPAPAPTLKIPPRYPPKAAREGIEGSVRVEFIIGLDGRPSKVRAVRSNPEDTFDSAAVRAVRKWRFPKQATQLRSFVTLEFKMEQLQ